MAKKTRRSKQQVFVEDNFDVQEIENGFEFIPKGGGDSVKIENVSGIKEASILLYNALNESDPEVSREGLLIEAASKFPTDKVEHGYIQAYAKYLPENPKSLLEIGCWKGNSLRMWREFFPDTHLATLDLFEEYPIPQDIENFQPFKGNQKDAELLDFIESHNYDVIIDDGSHNGSDQWAVVNKFLKPGKLVVIEDLHCNTEPFWNPGLPYEKTILGTIKSGQFQYKHELVNDKIVFIWG